MVLHNGLCGKVLESKFPSFFFFFDKIFLYNETTGVLLVKGNVKLIHVATSGRLSFLHLLVMEKMLI